MCAYGRPTVTQGCARYVGRVCVLPGWIGGAVSYCGNRLGQALGAAVSIGEGAHGERTTTIDSNARTTVVVRSLCAAQGHNTG